MSEPLDNDLLDLWIRAAQGLPVEEVRGLVDRIQTLRTQTARLVGDIAGHSGQD